MKSSEFIDVKKLKKAITDIRSQRDMLKKEQAKLRVQESRMKKLLIEAEK